MTRDLNMGNIETPGKLIEALKNLRDKRKCPQASFLLRGQPKAKYEGDLRPKIGRPYEYIGEKKTFNLYHEIRLLHRFRRHSYSNHERILNDWEAVFVARHYGLPTRLIDWTGNPLVALYFACEFYEKFKDSSKDNDGKVWVAVYNPEEKAFLNVFETLPKSWLAQKKEDLPESVVKVLPDKGSLLEVDEELDQLPEPLKVRGLRVVAPFYADPRMTAQHGMFTIQDDPWSDWSDSKFDKSHQSEFVDIIALYKWTVPQDKRKSIVIELEKMGVNYRTLFPDLTGLAAGLCQTEALRGLE